MRPQLFSVGSVTSQLPVQTTKNFHSFFDVHLGPPPLEKGSATHGYDHLKEVAALELEQHVRCFREFASSMFVVLLSKDSSGYTLWWNVQVLLCRKQEKSLFLLTQW